MTHMLCHAWWQFRRGRWYLRVAISLQLRVINEINSPGRTANQIFEFWLTHSFFSWNHASAWKTSISNEEMGLEKFGFIASGFLAIMKIGEEDHQTFTYACITLLPKVKREHSIINHAMFSFVDFWALIDMYHAWLGVKKCCFRVQVSPCLRVVLFHYTFGFLLSWTANCFSAETWIEFSDKPFIGDCKVHVVWRGLPFSPNFGLFWKKCAKT